MYINKAKRTTKSYLKTIIFQRRFNLEGRALIKNCSDKYKFTESDFINPISLETNVLDL